MLKNVRFNIKNSRGSCYFGVDVNNNCSNNGAFTHLLSQLSLRLYLQNMRNGSVTINGPCRIDTFHGLCEYSGTSENRKNVFHKAD